MLGKLSKLLSGRARDVRVHLGVFGKHPGWDDHIDDIGLDTEGLIAIKRVLYVDGISRNIDSGSWDKLQPGESIPGFDHMFVWTVGDSQSCGLIWSSSDGKGRSRYPMIACAQWTAERAVPVGAAVRVLGQLRDACVATTDRSRVLQGVGEARAQLDALPPEQSRRADLRRLGEAPGLLRVVYELGPALEEQFEGVGRQVRVPLNLANEDSGADPIAEMERWGAFLIKAGRGRPLLMIQPRGREWLDAVIGPVSPAHLFCLLAGERAMPLTTQIPFEIGPRDEARARAVVRAATGDA